MLLRLVLVVHYFKKFRVGGFVTRRTRRLSGGVEYLHKLDVRI